ncbi:E3 ubiquitin-protein ligase RNF25-like [Ctenocephalides felis]|uniref:E3 ubiquitin-protein ligase RNF25-like n=1 Tax=Ctenocephalides felis TaxID=7515 RepID=UPI000E6E359C|nr:E3 ubiquitin-protein ligase RNF25-like [Ctenocephalides felis]
MDERISDEIEALEAILMNDVTIQYNKETNYPDMIETVVFPSTMEDAQQQYVCITLQVWITPSYPDCAPVIKLKNPRGLDDNMINRIQKEVDKKMNQCLGQPVVFELIDVIREHLTDSNLPSGQCVICLYGFQEGDLFTKTTCYHYFHSHCLACHLVAGEKYHKEEQEKLPAWQRQQNAGFKALCPVCREQIDCDLEVLSLATPPVEVEQAQNFELTAELRALQTKMSELYLHQQMKGGIIDIEAEQNKLLLTTANSQDEDENNQISIECGAVSQQSTDTQNNLKVVQNANANVTNSSVKQQQGTEEANQQAKQNDIQKNHNKNIYKGGHYKNYQRGGYRGRGGHHSRRMQNRTNSDTTNGDR